MKCLIVLLCIAVASASHHVHPRSHEEREGLPAELWREMEGYEEYEEAYEAEDRVGQHYERDAEGSGEYADQYMDPTMEDPLDYLGGKSDEELKALCEQKEKEGSLKKMMPEGDSNQGPDYYLSMICMELFGMGIGEGMAGEVIDVGMDEEKIP